VDVAERFIEGNASVTELGEAQEFAWEAVNDLHGTSYLLEHASRAAAWTLHDTDGPPHPFAQVAKAGASDSERAASETGVAWKDSISKQSSILRCVFGNPFRPSKLDPSWLVWNGGAVPNVAAAAYEQRSLPSGHLDNDRLAVLADMLEEAGATDAALLSHLREPGAVHVRGCWAIDIILGKE
jgi:hypothetical protein